MYKLILVDDEAEVREGMRRRIDWASYGFVVTGEAENGREALDLLERDMPDVVVTDISMPIMNGLELSAALRERYPTVKIVILTGYDEFEYARQAIRLEVQDYVLKPVTAAGVGEILQKLREKIDAETALMEDMMTLRTHYRLSRPVMRDRFLTQLMRRGGEERALAGKARAGHRS